MIRTTSRTPITRMLALAAATLLIGACGGDDPVDSSSGAADLADMGAMADDLDDAAALAGVPEECLEISMAMSLALGAGMATESDPQVLTNLPAAFQSIRDKAPEELRADIDIVQQGYTEYLQVMEAYDYDFTKLASDPTAIEEMSAVMSGEEFSAASERFNDWLQSICG